MDPSTSQEAQIIHFQRALLNLSRLENSDFEAFLKKTLPVVAKLLGVERVSVWFFANDRSEIICQMLYSKSQRKFSNGLRLKAKNYPSYFKALEKSLALSAHDAEKDPRTREFKKKYLRPLGITSMLDIPIRSHGKLIGIVCHEHVGPPRHWAAEEEEYATSISSLIASSIDAADHRKAEEARSEAEARYRLVVSNSPIVLFAMDPHGTLTLSEGKGLEALGLKSGEVVGQSVFDLYKDDPQLLHHIREVLAGKITNESVELRGGPGKGRIFETFYTPVKGAKGKVIGVTGVATDVTERKRAEDRLQFLAYHDALTGLPNRLLLEDHLNLALAHARRGQELVGLILLDLDNFKEINDTLGHAAGDHVLKESANRMRSRLREGDTLARLGGDEFVLLLPQLKDPLNVKTIAERLSQAVQGSIRWGRHKIRTTVSMGGVSFPENGNDAKTLMRHVDIALYRAKKKGRNNFQFYKRA